jgi:hypothetical protein
MYALVYSIAVLKNDLSKFTIGFAKVPFGQAPIIALLAIAIFTFAAVLVAKYLFYSKAKPKATSVIALNIVFTIVASAFLETIAIYGLVLGFMYGAEVSSLTLTMLLITVLGGIQIFPREQQWLIMYETSLGNSAK